MIKVNITVGRPVADVWNYFTAVSNWSKWNGGEILQADWKKDGYITFGMGRPSRISEYEHQKLIKFNGAWFDTTYRFKSNGNVTFFEIEETEPRGASWQDGGFKHTNDLKESLAKFKNGIEAADEIPFGESAVNIPSNMSADDFIKQALMSSMIKNMENLPPVNQTGQTKISDTVSPPASANKRIRFKDRQFPGKNKNTAIILWLVSYFGFLQIYAFYLGMKKSALIKLALFIIPMVGIIITGISGGENPNLGLLMICSYIMMIPFIWSIVDLVKIYKKPTSDFCGGHEFKDCQCIKCGYRKPHTWNGCKCSGCGQTRDSEHAWEYCKCAVCGKTIDSSHKFMQISGKCAVKCEICGKIEEGQHSWEYCKCAVCGNTRDSLHNFKQISGECAVKCEICGAREEYHEWNGCKCSDCNRTRNSEHKWENGVCVICGADIDGLVSECVEELLRLYAQSPRGEGFLMRSSSSEPVRAIGERLAEAGGFKLMLRAHEQFSYVNTNGRNLEMCWDGIGGWAG